MTLYEIDNEIMNCIDEETGEIIDIDRLNALEMERDRKISNVACWIKDLKAEAEAIKAEKQSLDKRQKAAENKAESLKTWLQSILQGEKFKDSRCAISYRKSERVDFADNFNFDTLPDSMKKVTIEPRKTEIKDYLKTGATIEGVELVESSNIQIR
jgi:hypothetical protein